MHPQYICVIYVEMVHYFLTTKIFNSLNYNSDVDRNYKANQLTRSMIVNISDSNKWDLLDCYPGDLAKLSNVTWDPNNKILELSVANLRNDVMSVQLSQGMRIGWLAPSLASKFVYSSSLSHLFKPQGSTHK